MNIDMMVGLPPVDVASSSAKLLLSWIAALHGYFWNRCLQTQPRGDRRVTDVLLVEISRLYWVEFANKAPSSTSGHVMFGTLVVDR